MAVSIWEGSKAQALIDAINNIKEDVIPNRVKRALLNVAAKTAYIDVNGQDYYNDLESALYSDTPSSDVSSITAVFSQGSNVIFEDNTLNSLRQYLTVTANYEDGTSSIVSNYELSGSLNSATSTITVAYSEKTTTFTVSVTMPVFDYKASRDGKLSEMSGILVDSNDLSKFSESVTASGNLRLEGTENSAVNYLQFKIGNNPSTGLWRMKIRALIYSLSNTDYMGGLRPNISNGTSGLRFGMEASNGAADIIYYEGDTQNTVSVGLAIGEPETWYDFEMFINDSVPIQRLKIDGETIFESATFGTSAKNNSVFIVGKCLIFIDTVKLYNA